MRRGIGRRGAKPQQHEAIAEQVEVERPSASQACGAREPGQVEGTNCAVSAAGTGVPSGAQIGESS